VSRIPEVAVVERIAAAALLPVVELSAVDDAVPLLEALLEGGLPLAEITLRTAAAIEAIAVLRERYPDALVGAGTVRRVEDIERLAAVGALFVVSPGVNVDLVAACDALSLPAIPGACTPTEVDTALRAGARLVKLFPAEPSGGVPFVRAIAAPFPDARFVPTGGITAANLAAYLSVPQVAACGGSWLVSPTLIRERAFAEITARTREAVAIVKECRGESSLSAEAVLRGVTSPKRCNFASA